MEEHGIRNIPVVAYRRFLNTTETEGAANQAWDTFPFLVDIMSMHIEGEVVVNRALDAFELFHTTGTRQPKPSFWR
jgi:hypothetical protein